MFENKKTISLQTAIFPIIVLVFLLAINVSIYGDNALEGSNQFILLIGASIASLIGFKNKISYRFMIDKVADNLKSTTGAILILLFVGALAGTWLISGIIPAMIYYGLKIIDPSIFLPSCIIISAIISLATGSSWSTSATVGIALIGIGKALGFPPGMVAGAVISGSYFGDKLSPLSDTTNLASAMSGCDLFVHIKYMLYTTIPSILVTIIVFLFLGFFQDISTEHNSSTIIESIEQVFNLNISLFIVPALVILMILKKTPPLIALMIGTLLGGIFAVIFQPTIVHQITNSNELNLISGYMGIMNAMTIYTEIPTSNELLNDLFQSGGMQGMLGTIWLVICAMVFGGVMDSIGALTSISNSLLKSAKSTFGLILSTSASCISINLTASDQYLSIVIPGKMFDKAYKDRKLAPENLSRTLEDSGTVTSVLIPWNTCGAYQSNVLGVNVSDYFIYAIFNWISPVTTLVYAYFKIKIAKI
tara:strand:- start:153 stop:1583 length:1431 start_codon:yes stop_codon:yes gene_type:complete